MHVDVPRSSSGRTEDSGSSNGGSNPSLGIFISKLVLIMRISPISFKSTYSVDTSTAESRTQVFTLGALMNNFWINSPNSTFTKIRNSGLYETVDINVKDYKDDAFERVLKNNEISYTKKATRKNLNAIVEILILNYNLAT